MKPFNHIFATLLLIVFLTSCGKRDNYSPSNTTLPDKLGSSYNKRARIWKNGVKASLVDLSGNASGNAVYVTGSDVYVAGFDNHKAMLWKNGVANALTDGSKHASANSVYVSGNDVYVAGFEMLSDVEIAKIWKNGSPINLTNGSRDAAVASVYVSNNNVYAAGYSVVTVGNYAIRAATLWKNGVATTLSNVPSSAISLCLSGDDVYVAGEEHPSNDPIVKIWKNGVLLQNAETFKNSLVNSIYVSGNDIYAAGNQLKPYNGSYIHLASIWKNNEVSYLTDITKDGAANSVYVNNNNVYVAGVDYTGTKTTVTDNNTVNEFGVFYAKIWKNGVGTPLTDATKRSAANSVFVAGNDVYVTGWESDK